MATLKEFIENTDEVNNALGLNVICTVPENDRFTPPGAPMIVVEIGTENRVWCSKGRNTLIKMPYYTAELEIMDRKILL